MDLAGLMRMRRCMRTDRMRIAVRRMPSVMACVQLGAPAPMLHAITIHLHDAVASVQYSGWNFASTFCQGGYR
jgi:hypothetical protein